MAKKTWLASSLILASMCVAFALDLPPEPLTQAGDSATSLFDAAEAQDWAAANEYADALARQVDRFPSPMPKPDLVGQIRSDVHALKDGVQAHQRLEVMNDANRITLRVNDLIAEFEPEEPIEVKMLGYYGRQLELALAAARPDALAQTRADLRSTWTRIEMTVEGRGGPDAARRFTDILADLDTARRPADYVAPTRAELAESTRLDKLFEPAR